MFDLLVDERRILAGKCGCNQVVVAIVSVGIVGKAVILNPSSFSA